MNVAQNINHRANNEQIVNQENLNVPQRNADDVVREMPQIDRLEKIKSLALEQQYKSLRYNEFHQNSCSICFEEFRSNDQVRETQCKHLFHSKCILDWAQKQISQIQNQNQEPDCPNCKFSLLKRKEIVQQIVKLKSLTIRKSEQFQLETETGRNLLEKKFFQISQEQNSSSESQQSDFEEIFSNIPGAKKMNKMVKQQQNRDSKMNQNIQLTLKIKSEKLNKNTEQLHKKEIDDSIKADDGYEDISVIENQQTSIRMVSYKHNDSFSQISEDLNEHPKSQTNNLIQQHDENNLNSSLIIKEKPINIFQNPNQLTTIKKDEEIKSNLNSN
eukprot:403341056